MKFEAYSTICHQQDAGSWVAEIPAIASCDALMPTREEALPEPRRVSGMIEEEFREKGLALSEDSAPLTT